jgi:hypothetical protein
MIDHTSTLQQHRQSSSIKNPQSCDEIFGISDDIITREKRYFLCL